MISVDFDSIPIAVTTRLTAGYWSMMEGSITRAMNGKMDATLSVSKSAATRLINTTTTRPRLLDSGRMA